MKMSYPINPIHFGITIMACRRAYFRNLLRTSLLLATSLGFGPTSTGICQGTRPDPTEDDARIYWPRYDFVIPYNIEQTGQTPREIQLEYSPNSGKTWLLYSTSDVRTKQFQFRATQDGEFLFRLKTLDSQGRSFDNPGEPLSVVVDTTKPTANLVVDIDERGVMLADFAIEDLAVDTESIELTFQTDAMIESEKIKFSLEYSEQSGEWLGSGSWTIPNSIRQMSVRLTAKDKAGNLVETSRFPKLPRSAGAMTGLQLASGRSRDSRPSTTPSMVDYSAPIGSGLASGIDTSRPRIEVLTGPGRSAPSPDSRLTAAIVERQQQLIEQLISNQHTTNEQLLNSSLQNRASSANNLGIASSNAAGKQAQSFSGPATAGPMSSALSTMPLNADTTGATGRLKTREMTSEELEQIAAPKQMGLVANRSDKSILVRDSDGTSLEVGRPANPSSGVESRPQIEPNRTGRSTLTSPPAERIAGQTTFRNNIKPLFSKSRAFSLDYAIENDPDSPVASVELWGTSDEGQTWQLWGQDQDRSSPFDIKVETEGLFGFRMIIVGANGLASNRPRNGDNADAWIHVDTELPYARIQSALYGKGKEAGSLVIEYQASDDHFPERPIALSYAQTPDGPWTKIASDLRNNGRYIWPADPSLPQAIYLQLEAFDAAGNVASHRLENAINVEGLAPRGRIQGFRPLP
jgi:hypothetical protein